jgi:hypothetical protein
MRRRRAGVEDGLATVNHLGKSRARGRARTCALGLENARA